MVGFGFVIRTFAWHLNESDNQLGGYGIFQIRLYSQRGRSFGSEEGRGLETC